MNSDSQRSIERMAALPDSGRKESHLHVVKTSAFSDELLIPPLCAVLRLLQHAAGLQIVPPAVRHCQVIALAVRRRAVAVEARPTADLQCSVLLQQCETCRWDQETASATG